MNISALQQLSVDWGQGPATLLSETQHLLRRFGSIELMQIDKSAEEGYRVRGEADEILIPLKGAATLEALDLREGSPTQSNSMQIDLSQEKGSAALVPFGVAYRISVESPADILRVASHSEGTHGGDRLLSPAEVEAALE